MNYEKPSDKELGPLRTGFIEAYAGQGENKKTAERLGETKSIGNGLSWAFLTLRCLQYGLLDLPNKGLDLAFRGAFGAMGMGKGYERGLRWGGKIFGAGECKRKKEDK